MGANFPPADFAPQLASYTGQGAFRFWCQKVLPIVYDDSLSYYELLNKVVVYLNNVISDFGTMVDNLDEVIKCFNELQNYVNEYLDLESAVSKKLDEMAADGTLYSVFYPVISVAFQEWLNEHPEAATTVDYTITTKVHNNVAELKSDMRLNVGDKVQTIGYYEAYDGGGAVYEISDTPPNLYYEELNNGKFAGVITQQNVSAKMFGVTPSTSKTDVLNVIDGVIISGFYPCLTIEPDLNYGYSKANNIRPDIYACPNRMIVYDYSIDDGYSEADSGTNAFQLRLWVNTPEIDGNFGQHDGNGIMLNGPHHPYLQISNDCPEGQYNQSRASIIFAKEQTRQWMITQENNNSPTVQHDTPIEYFQIRALPVIDGVTTIRTVFASRLSDRRVGIGDGAFPVFPVGLFGATTIITENSEFLRYIDDRTDPTKDVRLEFDGVNFGLKFGTKRMLLVSKTANTSVLHLYSYDDTSGQQSKHIIISVSETAPLKVMADNTGNVLIEAKTNGVIEIPKGLRVGTYTSEERPTDVAQGTMIYDTTLDMPLWLGGHGVWHDAMGNAR